MVWDIVANALQGHVNDLIVLLATLSLTAWAVVAATVFVRLAAQLRYRRRAPASEPADEA